MDVIAAEAHTCRKKIGRWVEDTQKWIKFSLILLELNLEKLRWQWNKISCLQSLDFINTNGKIINLTTRLQFYMLV